MPPPGSETQKKPGQNRVKTHFPFLRDNLKTVKGLFVLSFFLSRNFTFLHNFVYGNCYVFSEKGDTKTTSVPGSENGELRL